MISRNIELNHPDIESPEEISSKIRGARQILKEVFKKDRRLGVEISEGFLVQVPVNLRDKDIDRLSEIISVGFKNFKLEKIEGSDKLDFGSEISMDSVLTIPQELPLIDVLDTAVVLANRLGKEVNLITGDGENCFTIPFGLKNGVDKEDVDSDVLILIDALEKGFEVREDC